MTASSTANPAPAPPVTGRSGPAHARDRSASQRVVAALCVAAAWLLPLVAHGLHVDWLVLIAAWLGIGSLLRAGRLLVDRLVLAGILLAGFLIAAGLLFSVWPWGLAPVPVGGVTLSTVVAAAVLSGRRPHLPNSFVPTDAVILGAGALSWYCLNAPTAGKSFAAKLPYIAAREDMFNHYMLFDAIHRVGGYAFLSLGAVKPYMSPTAMDFYPQGMHYLFALVDVFARSTTDPGSNLGEYDRFALYNIAVLAILATVLVWAARWIAGPGIAGWRRGFVCVVVGGLATVGQFTTLYWQAFAAGLVVLAAAVAVCARPPRGAREHVLLLAAAIVASAFVYNLTAVMVVGMTAIAIAVDRRRLRDHRRFALLVGAPAILVALVPYAAEMFAGFSALHFARVPLIVFALAGLSALLTRTGRRSPTWRVASYSVLWCCASTAALLVGVIPLPPTTMRDGSISSDFSAPLTTLAKHHILGDGIPTIVVLDDKGQTNRRVSMFNAALNHDRGVITDRAIDAIMNSNDLATLQIPEVGTPIPAEDVVSLANLGALIKTSHVPLRIVVSNRDLADYLRALGAADPDLKLKVDFLQ